MLYGFLISFALSLVRGYMKSPSSKYDDLILQGVKDGVDYLAPKKNNTVDSLMSYQISNQAMRDL